MYMAANYITEYLLPLFSNVIKGYGKNTGRIDKTNKQLKQRLEQLMNENYQLRNELTSLRLQTCQDSLTGIANRRAYEQRVLEEVNRTKRSQKSFALLVWDIDHFKQVNDNFGHQTGDQVLKAFAAKLADFTRNSDFTARIGGEEFVTLITDCNWQQAYKRAESLRNELSRLPIETDKGNKFLTVSCGIAVYLPGNEINGLFSRADKALYRAKRNGRNRVCAEINQSGLFTE